MQDLWKQFNRCKKKMDRKMNKNNQIKFKKNSKKRKIN